jgi:hypothetical protein
MIVLLPFLGYDHEELTSSPLGDVGLVLTSCYLSSPLRFSCGNKFDMDYVAANHGQDQEAADSPIQDLFSRWYPPYLTNWEALDHHHQSGEDGSLSFRSRLVSTLTG